MLLVTGITVHNGMYFLNEHNQNKFNDKKYVFFRNIEMIKFSKVYIADISSKVDLNLYSNSKGSKQ